MLDNAKSYIRSESYLHKLEVVAEKEINYGVQLLLCNINSSFDDSVPINIYYSKKKGISIVVGGSAKSTFRKDVLDLAEKTKIAAYNDFRSSSSVSQPQPQDSLSDNSLTTKSTKSTENISYQQFSGQVCCTRDVPDRQNRQKPTASNSGQYGKLHSWTKWVGTDESGKGDFFGHLVAAGFYCDTTICEDLLKTCVIDSKKLKDKQIEKTARLLYKKYRRRIEVVSLTPETYNKLYADFHSGGKKLNELMAWMHSRIIINLARKFPVEGALIDKFTSDYKVRASLKEMQKISLIQFPRAEQDLAVAAASIIARYHFLQGLDSLSKRYDMKLPKGANKTVIDTGREFIRKHSQDELRKVCKTHFKTYSQVTTDTSQSNNI